MKPPRKITPPAGPRQAAEFPAAACEIRYTRDAAAEIKTFAGSIRKRLREVIEKKLSVRPDEYGTPLCGELAGYWKHEFARHRLIYRIYAAEKIVAVCAVGVRKAGDAQDVYRQLQSIAETGRLAGQLAEVLSALLPKKR